MPRKPRFFLPGVPVHVVQRGHNREPVFFDTPDYQTYLHWLQEAADRYQCFIHAYVLMTNHIHLLVTPQNKNSVSQMMQYEGIKGSDSLIFHPPHASLPDNVLEIGKPHGSITSLRDPRTAATRHSAR